MEEDSRRPWQAGLQAARAHLGPGLLLQAVGLALVCSYYFSPWARAELNAFMGFKLRVGLIFGLVSTAIFGGFLPWLYLWRDGRYSTAQGGWLLAFWAERGIEVELLYRLEARWFGAGHDAGTILSKVVFDQFVYSLFWSVPGMLIFYDWLEHGRVRPLRELLRQVLPMLVSNLGVWLPMTALIYALPTPLQLPLENLVLCFYTLLVAHQSLHHSDEF